MLSMCCHAKRAVYVAHSPVAKGSNNHYGRRGCSSRRGRYYGGPVLAGMLVSKAIEYWDESSVS